MKWLRLLVWLTFAAASSVQAQIAVRGASQASLTSGTAAAITIAAGGSAERANCGNINPAIPAGAVGDLLVAQVIARRSAATITMTGWNVLFSDNNAGGAGTADDLQSILYWRSATGTDPNTISQAGTCDQFYARITSFGNVDVARPLETFPLPAANWVYSNADNVDTGTQVVNAANSMLVMATFVADDQTVAQPGTWTQLYDNADNSGDDIGISMNYRIEATTGSKGPVTNMDLSGAAASVPNHGVLFAVRPGTGNNLVVDVPAGTVDGDVMIASITFRPCTAGGGSPCTTSAATPLGWSLVTPGTNTVNQTTGGGTGGTGHRLLVYSKVAASEPASYTWTIAGTPVHAGAAGGIVSFSGVDTGNPIVTSLGQAPAGASTSHTATEIDTSPVTNTMLVAIFTSNSSAFWTMPGTMTEQVDAPTRGVPDALGVNLGVATELRAAAGLTGNRTASYSAPAPAGDTGATLMLALRPAGTVSHYGITQPSGANFATCEPAVVRITAHNAAHAAVNPPAGTTLTIRTSTNTGIWQTFSVGAGDLGTAGNFLSSGANNGQATYVWSGTESVLQVRLRHNTVASPGVNLNPASSPQEDPTEDPAFNFSNAVWRITADGSTTASVNTQIAGKESNVGAGAQTLFVQAVASAPATGACSAVFRNQTLNVDFAAVCNNPATCSAVAGTEAAVRNSGGTFTNIAKNNGAPAAYTAVSLAFSNDANAMAPFAVRYGDAGQITIHMRYALLPTGDMFTGSSNAFVTRPFGLRITGANSTTPLTTSPTPLPTDPVFAIAGANFNTTITAVQWKAGDDTSPLGGDGLPDNEAQISGNAATPNFGQESTPATVTLSHTLSAPSSGGVAGALSGTTFSGFSAGTKTQAVNWSEVGFINLFATTTNYLGAGNVTNSAAGLTGVGRFKPADFLVAAAGPAPALTNRLSMGCAPASTFSYMNEGMGIRFMLQARNTAGNVTQNYTGSYARLDTLAELRLDAVSGATNLGTRLDTSAIPVPGFANGEFTVDTTIMFRRRSPDDPDGPFPSTAIGIAPTDEDGTALQTAALNMDVDGVGGNDHQRIGNTTEVRFGRLRMENAVGSEKLALPIRIETQHWSGSGFVTNTLDSCTSFPRSAVVLGGYTGAIDPAGGNCKTFVQQDPIAFSGGVGGITLASPAGAAAGTLLLTVNLGTSASGTYCSGTTTELPATFATRNYLLGRWNDASDSDANANTRYDDSPSSRAAFGLYGGQPNNFIYFRENY